MPTIEDAHERSVGSSCANPKSPSLTHSEVPLSGHGAGCWTRKMLAGFTSRWSVRWRWRWLSADASCAMISHTSETSSRRSVRSLVRRSSRSVPPQSSHTRVVDILELRNASKRRTMKGDESFESERASRSDAASSPPSITFSATRRPLVTEVAANVVANEPRPMYVFALKSGMVGRRSAGS